MATSATMNTDENVNIGIDDRKAVVDILNRVLSDEYVLYTKTRNYHWNVTGPLFRTLHLMFEEQYTAMAISFDETAERARSLGGNALGTMEEFIGCASLKEEKPNTYPEALEMVSRLVADHEAVIRNLREFVDVTDEKFSDMGTSDFLTAKMEAHEKMAWMLRSFLDDK